MLAPKKIWKGFLNCCLHNRVQAQLHGGGPMYNLKDEILRKINFKTFYSQYFGKLPEANDKNEIMVICPFHQDKDPSLSINLKTGFYHCFGCKEKGDVFRFYEKKHNIPFTVALNRMAKDLGIENRGEKDHFDYKNEDGETIFRVIRYEDGKGIPHRKDENGNWIPGIKGHVEPVLFNLPDLLREENREKPIHITEGEPDAVYLSKLGFLSTTNALGALNWKQAYNDIFKGRDVILYEDNDQAGRDRTKKLTDNLSGIAKSIKVIPFSELPEKGDVSDWLNSRSTQSTIRKQLCLGARIYNTAFCGSATATPDGIEIKLSRQLEAEVTAYPDFPEEVLTGLAGDFAKAQAECVEVPEHFLFISFLTSLGALVSGKATIKNALSIQPRMYTLLLGETSGGRKSTAIKIVTRFFADALKEDDFKISWGFGSAEGLQKRLADAQNLLFCLDEFKSFVSKATIKSSVLLPAVTQLFESNEYENQTKTSHIKIVNGHLSMLAASTIDTYTRTWDSSFTDIGFLNRIFLVVGKSERKYAFPKKLNDTYTQRFKSELQAIVKRIYDADKGILELEFTSEASEIHNEWYKHRESSMYSHRLNAYALRLMILFVLNEGKARIDKEIVDKVITLIGWQLEIRRVLSPVEGDNPAAIMEEKIRRMLSAKGDMTKRELRQYTNADRGGLWLFDAALSNLIKAEDVAEVHCDRSIVYHFTG